MTTVSLNDVNINEYVAVNSLNIDDSIGERSTCEFTAWCSDGTLNIEAGMRVDVQTDDTKVFAGTIDNVDKTAILGTSPQLIEYSIQCTDWHQICDRRIVSEAYENVAARDIVESLIQGYLKDEGINSGWLSGWAKRIKLTVDQNDIDAALSDFPILVHLGESVGRNNDDVSCVFDELQSDVNRKKIAVTTSDSTTQCYVEIEKWDDANEEASLWAKVPSIASGADTELYLYFDASHADNTAYVGDPSDAVVHNVWDSNFKLVTHMKDDPDTSHIRDSTVNANDGTKKAINEPIEAAGKIDKAQDFDGANDYVVVDAPAGGSLNPSHITMEMWIKFDVIPYGGMALNKESKYRLFGNDVNASRLSIRYATTDTSWTAGTLAGNTPLSADVWYHGAATYDGSEWKLYLNGELDGSKSESGNLISNSNNLCIGTTTVPGTIWAVFIDASIDEVRISDTARSAAWIKASYESERDDLLDWGSEEYPSIQAGPTVQQAVFNYVPATQCLDKLADLSDFMWWIDSNKVLRFCDRALYQAPFNITETTAISRVRLSHNRDNYRNRQYIRAGKGTTDPQTETFKGDGAQKTFTVGFPVAKVPTVSVNDIQKTVGIRGIDEGKDWYWSKGDAGLTQDTSGTPLAATDTLKIVYQGLYDVIALTDDNASIENRKTVEGGTGWYEAVNEEPHLTTAEAAFQGANALLKRYAMFGHVLSFDTLLTGLHTGQLVQVNLPAIDAVGEYLIRKVQYRDICATGHDYVFSVEAVTCFAADTWTKFFKTNLGQPKTFVIRENIQEQEILIRLVQQSESTSWSELLTQTIFACPVPAVDLYPSTTLYPC